MSSTNSSQGGRFWLRKRVSPGRSEMKVTNGHNGDRSYKIETRVAIGYGKSPTKDNGPRSRDGDLK